MCVDDVLIRHPTSGRPESGRCGSVAWRTSYPTVRGTTPKNSRLAFAVVRHAEDFAGTGRGRKASKRTLRPDLRSSIPLPTWRSRDFTETSCGWTPDTRRRFDGVRSLQSGIGRTSLTASPGTDALHSSLRRRFEPSPALEDLDLLATSFADVIMLRSVPWGIRRPFALRSHRFVKTRTTRKRHLPCRDKLTRTAGAEFWRRGTCAVRRGSALVADG